MIDEKTKIEEMDLDINEVLDLDLGVDEKKKGLFDEMTPDTSFLNKAPEDVKSEIDDEEKSLNKEEGKKPDVEKKGDDDETIDEIVSAFNQEEDDDSGKGRPKINKDGLLDFTKKMIEKGRLIPFEDEKPLEDYTMKDFEELYEANEEEKRRKLEEEVPMKFFDAMPPKMQVALKYVADGGRDYVGLFKALAQTEEIISLDPQKDSERIVRTYLESTNFGDNDEIQEEIDAWRDRGELENKAEKFKPKLDSMQEEIIARKSQEQENRKKLQEQKTQKYLTGITETLSKGELNGIKLDKKTQSMLYEGLVEPKHFTSDGRPTNKLIHLLEKYQFVEPNHELLSEALWLLSDPDGYRSKLKGLGSKEEKEETFRKLKTAESEKATSVYKEEEKDKNRMNKLKRPNRSIFG